MVVSRYHASRLSSPALRSNERARGPCWYYQRCNGGHKQENLLSIRLETDEQSRISRITIEPFNNLRPVYQLLQFRHCQFLIIRMVKLISIQNCRLTAAALFCLLVKPSSSAARAAAFALFSSSSSSSSSDQYTSGLLVPPYNALSPPSPSACSLKCAKIEAKEA